MFLPGLRWATPGCMAQVSGICVGILGEEVPVPGCILDCIDLISIDETTPSLRQLLNVIDGLGNIVSIPGK